MFWGRQEGWSTGEDGSNLDRVTTKLNRRGSFVSENLTDRSNPHELYIYQIFKRTKHSIGIKFRSRRSNITRDNVLWKPIFQEKFCNFLSSTSNPTIRTNHQCPMSEALDEVNLPRFWGEGISTNVYPCESRLLIYHSYKRKRTLFNEHVKKRQYTVILPFHSKWQRRVEII